MTTSKLLQRLIEERVGPVVTLNLPLTSQGLCVGHAYVVFHTKTAFEESVFRLRGLTLRGHQVYMHELPTPLDSLDKDAV